MTEPILTISIAAYNVADYLGRALESLRGVSGIEVLVIDDGSTDATASVAERFAAEDPGTFRLISKENGGYGSTVNRGLSEARGKYFKLLDGDDWVKTDALEGLINMMRDSDADLLFMPRVTAQVGRDEMTDDGDFPYQNGETINLLKMDRIVGHWHIAIRTDVLRNQFNPLPAHTLYTDQLFVIQALSVSRTVRFYKNPVYCYYVGREGQSVTLENRISHIGDLEVVTELGNKMYSECLEHVPADNRGYLMRRVAQYDYTLVLTYLLLDTSAANRRRLISFELGLKCDYPDIYALMARLSRRIRLTRAFNYSGYWITARLTNSSWG